MSPTTSKLVGRLPFRWEGTRATSLYDRIGVNDSRESCSIVEWRVAPGGRGGGTRAPPPRQTPPDPSAGARLIEFPFVGRKPARFNGGAPTPPPCPTRRSHILSL